MRSPPLPIAISATLALAAGALAQPPLSPLDAATEPASDRPLLIAPAAPPDEAISSLLRSFTGSFASDGPTKLLFRGAPITIRDLPNCILIELSRADSPADPFRLYVLHAYRRKSALHLRTFDLPAASGLAAALAGLALAPDTLPTLDSAALAPSLDMLIEPSTSDTTRARTEHPFPINRAGAIEMTASLTASPTTIQLSDTGLDAQGNTVWGGASQPPQTFTRVTTRPTLLRDGDVTAITTLAPPADAAKLTPGGQILIQYTSWLTTGQLIETSRGPGKQPVTVHVPGAILPGLNKGLVGISVGERRKLIIGPDLAYGAEGRALIPAKATLIFEVECLNVDNSATPPPAAPTRMFNPHAAPPGATPPATPHVDGPIGSPPTNGGPETPRGSH